MLAGLHAELAVRAFDLNFSTSAAGTNIGSVDCLSSDCLRLQLGTQPSTTIPAELTELNSGSIKRYVGHSVAVHADMHTYTHMYTATTAVKAFRQSSRIHLSFGHIKRPHIYCNSSRIV